MVEDFALAAHRDQDTCLQGGALPNVAPMQQGVEGGISWTPGKPADNGIDSASPDSIYAASRCV